MNTDLSPAIRDLLNCLLDAGFEINEVEVDGEYYNPPPRHLDDAVLKIEEGLITDIGLKNPDGTYGAWMRIVTGNDPCAIVNDYGVNDALEKVVEAHSNRWENCKWVPVPIKKQITMKTPYPGLDYSGPGSDVNRDDTTGIRCGVISCNSVGQSLYDAQEMDYGSPHCPKCGNPIRPPSDLDEEFQDEEWADGDYACQDCKEGFDSGECFPDEAIGWHVDDGEYIITDCLDNDAMVIKSPYYTYAQFCSPCVPGAGNLDNPMTMRDNDERGGVWEDEEWRSHCESLGFPKTFCLGWDWFDEDNPCPYPAIYRVDNDEPVLPSTEPSDK